MGDLQVLAFSLRGKIGHFRQPDTTVTQATYPFPPRPTLHGLLGAILGIDHWSEKWPQFLRQEHFIGLKLLSPIRTVCVQMSLLGKGFLSGQADAFNRPTVVELVVAPHYRIYYAGEALTPLKERLANRQAVYHTYLGSCYCLTFPQYEGVFAASSLETQVGQRIVVGSVVPEEVATAIGLQGGATYAVTRVMPYTHRGDRTFEGSVKVLYEVSGKPLTVTVQSKAKLRYQLLQLPNGEVICLW